MNMEHSDKTRENTEWVAVWIVNDGDYYFTAQEYAREGVDELAVYLTDVLHAASPNTGAWHTAQELSANDYERIDWQSIADDLLGE